MNDSVKLDNGIAMPRLGLGTWQIADGDDTYRAVSAALNTGYRLIDTAAIYGNEAGVGRAVTDSTVPRDDIFVTTKLWNSDQGQGKALAAFEASLDRLQLDYVDLYLIHWPDPKQNKFIETWQVLERIYSDGKARAIGVSNFKPPHLDQLLEVAKVTPMVNQIELHPYFTQQSTREYCAKHNIQVESYSPLMRAGDILENKTLQSVAEQHSKTAAQVIVRWHLQHDLVVIPKSSNPQRIAENFDVFDFELPQEQMAEIDALNSDQRIGTDPDH